MELKKVDVETLVGKLDSSTTVVVDAQEMVTVMSNSSNRQQVVYMSVADILEIAEAIKAQQEDTQEEPEEDGYMTQTDAGNFVKFSFPNGFKPSEDYVKHLAKTSEKTWNRLADNNDTTEFIDIEHKMQAVVNSYYDEEIGDAYINVEFLNHFNV